MSSKGVTYRLGVDIGGTFTDLILLGADGSARVKKVDTSVSGGFEQAVITGIKALLTEAGIPPGTITEVSHAATVATNAVVERKGPVTGLVTTEGFRDVLEIRRLRNPTNDLFWNKPEPLVARRMRLEVSERIGGHGEVVIALDTQDARQVVNKLVASGAKALAVCLLNSVHNPGHEQLIAEVVRKDHPRIWLSVSTEMGIGNVREYERTSTTVLNSYLMPIVSTYVQNMRQRLDAEGVRAPLLIMDSGGGMMTSEGAAQRPVATMESGPGAGVLAASHVAGEIKQDHLLSFDMGGTTVKASLIEHGEPHWVPEHEVAGEMNVGSMLQQGGGYHVMGRTIDLAEVGAGGGSIVRVDQAGGIKVGPRSAGAVPGPVCYGTGGEEITVTDTNLLLGYLNPNYLLGGTLKVDRVKTEHIFREKVAKPLGMSVHEAAQGVHVVANSTMSRALRAVSIERGYDVRDLFLLAFGGGGPVHAAGLADLLGVKGVAVPPLPGLFSTMGLLWSRREMEFVQPYWRRLADLSGETLDATYQTLEERARESLQKEGVDPRNIEFVRHADARYVEQIYEMIIRVPPVSSPSELIPALVESFEQEHKQRYGHIAEGEPVQITSIRVIGRERAAQQALGLRSLGDAIYKTSAPQGTSRPVYFGRDAGTATTPVVSRRDLDKSPRKGPMIIEEYDSTIVVPPWYTARRDDNWVVFLERPQ